MRLAEMAERARQWFAFSVHEYGSVITGWASSTSPQGAKRLVKNAIARNFPYIDPRNLHVDDRPVGFTYNLAHHTHDVESDLVIWDTRNSELHKDDISSDEEDPYRAWVYRYFSVDRSARDYR